MLTLLFLISSFILGLVTFSLCLYYYLHYKKIAPSLPKTDEIYKKLRNKEYLGGILSFYLSSFGQIALCLADMIMTNWGGVKFYLYLVPIVISFTIGMLYWSFYVRKKREKFFQTFADKTDFRGSGNLGILTFFKGMSTSFGNSVGLLLIFIFWSVL